MGANLLTAGLAYWRPSPAQPASWWWWATLCGNSSTQDWPKACHSNQVSGTLARMEPPQRISHESIYSAIYAMPIGELRKEVIALLRKHHKGRRPRTAGKDRRQLIIGMTSIEERPLSVEDRLVPGHWEGDLTARATSPRTRARWAVGANRTARKKARATPSAATSIWPGPLLRRRTSRCATTLRSNAGTCLPTHAPENTGRPWAGLTTSTATASCLATACR